MRASTAFLARAALVAALAMAAAGFAARAHAGESPTAFNLAQAAHPLRPAQRGEGGAKRPQRMQGIRFEMRAGAPIAETGATDVIREALRFVGSGNPTGIRAAWCAFFVSMVLRATGHRPLPNGLSYSALSYGPHLAGPRVGALIVLPHHVGFVAGVSGDRVTMLSGNWGRRVALAVLPIRAAIAYIGVD